MSLRAWVYIYLVLLSGLAISLWALLGAPAIGAGLPAFLVFVALATFAQLYTARAPGHQSYHFTLVFLMASALLLTPAQFVLVAAIPHLVEWVRERWTNSPRLRNWYLQPFNIANHIIAGLLARQIFILFGGDSTHLITTGSLFAALFASIAYDLINHLLVGLALMTARQVPFRDSGILDFENLGTDLILLVMGATVAVAWTLNPLFVPLALSPIWLMFQALKVPQLKQEAKTDPKTGLANARYITEMLTNEIGRARRFERPIAVIMSDLDLLRNVNNTYGHLAGDAVLAGIGQILRKMIREYDLAGRFGGEEFLLVLPETQLPEAYTISERIRETIEAATFPIPTSATPIRVTMSFGIACFPKDAQMFNDLIHQADIAVYQAKLQGRNRVICAVDVPHSARFEIMPHEDDRVTAPTPVYTPRPIEPPPGNTVVDSTPMVEPSAAIPPVIPVAPPNRNYRRQFPVLVTLVIIAGSLVAFLGFVRDLTLDLTTLTVLLGLALFAQLPQVKNLYGESSISLSMGITFAAALLAGIPGVSLVSLVIVLVHYAQRRPVLYKTAYNWATHVLAGTAPALAVSLIPNHLQLPNLLWTILLSIGTALVFFLVETGLIASGISFSEGTSIERTWRDRYRWLAPQYIVLSFMGLFLSVAYVALGLLGVLVYLTPIFMMYYTQKQYIEHTLGSVNELKRMNTELGVANREILAASTMIRTINDELFMTLSKIIDARDPFVSGHSAQVAVYATAIAEEMGLPAERIQNVRQAALMHDIGKIGITEKVLNKPGRLDPSEYTYVKTHAVLGADFVATSHGLGHLAPYIRHHHEHWDSQGYPAGLKGEEIPLEARILSVCDAVESMASDRPYHRALSLDEILKEIERCAGTQFDPQVAETCIRILKRDADKLLVNSARKISEHQASQAPTSHDPKTISTDTALMPTDAQRLSGNLGV